MKLTNRKLMESKEGFEKVLKILLPTSVSFRLAQAAKEVNSHLEVVKIVSDSLIKEHGEINENGLEFISMQSPGYIKFQKEIEILKDEEVEITFGEKIKMPTNVQMEGIIFLTLDDFIYVEMPDDTQKKPKSRRK